MSLNSGFVSRRSIWIWRSRSRAGRLHCGCFRLHASHGRRIVGDTGLVVLGAVIGRAGPNGGSLDIRPAVFVIVVVVAAAAVAVAVAIRQFNSFQMI